MVVEKRTNRQAAIFAAAEQRHHESVVRRWRESAPDRTNGFTIQDDLIEGRWNGRISDGGIRSVRKYLKHPTQFLILKGQAGLGKSTLAVTMISELLQNHYPLYTSGRYDSAPLLMQEFSFPDRDSEDPIRRSIRVPILLLDDVGAANESMTAHQRKGLWSVIDARWGNRNKLTLMTTNMSVTSTNEGQGLIDWFGESAWDRIKDDLTLIDFHGESMRGED